MATENIITIVGNLADDPELRFTPNGVAVANCRVAVNQRFYNRETNQWDERLDGFFRVNVWRDYGENVAESLHRGDRVLVTGRLRSRSYEDRDGNERWVTEIEADEVCPTLRFATAKPTKVNRSGGGRSSGDGDGGGGGGGGQGWGQSAPPAAEPPTSDDVPF